ncbi:MAG: phosphatase PAP2 family protein [Bacteroidota bacterium]
MKSVFSKHFNLYFFVPFFLWCMVGAYLLFRFDSTTLFAFINNHYNPASDRIMEWASKVGEGWMIAVICVTFFLFKPFRNPWFFATAVLCTVLPALITQLIKFQMAAPRPMTVYQNQNWVHHLDHWDLLHNNSFPSGHTTGAFSFLCLLSCVIPQKYWPIGFVFFVLALAVGYARVYLAAHFFRDVYFGSIIGTVFSFIICLLVFYFKDKREQRL